MTASDNKYVFNNVTIANKRFLLYKTEYTFTVPSGHPIGFIFEPASAATVQTEDDKPAYRFVDGKSVPHYHGTVRLTITEEFMSGSFHCLYHGYMGGLNKFAYGGVALREVYDSGSGTKMMIAQTIVRHEDAYVGGTLYAVTDDETATSYVVYIDGVAHSCIGKGDALSSYVDAQGKTRSISWGSYYTLMISLDSQPSHIKFLHVDARGIVRHVEQTLNGRLSSETTSFMPATMPNVDAPTSWMILDTRDVYTPVISVVNKTVAASIVEGLAPIEVSNPIVAFDVHYEDFAYHTILYATIKNDGSYMSDIGDVLVASDSLNRVRGVSSTIIQHVGVPMFVIQVYSSGGYENIRFSTAQVKSARMYELGSVLLNMNGAYTKDSPLVFNVGRIQRAIQGPYDWVSVNVETEDMSFLRVFDSFIENIQAIRNKTSVVYRANGAWIGNISTIHTDTFYILKTTGAGPYTWTFDAGLISNTAQPIIQNGYNWISYPLLFDTTISTFVTKYMARFEPYVTTITSQKGFLVRSDGWFGTLTQFTPNEGYIIHVQDLPEVTEMSYPNASLDYTTINTDVVTGEYTLHVEGIPFMYDDMYFNVHTRTHATMSIEVDGTRHVVSCDVQSGDFTSLVPTLSTGTFDVPVNTTIQNIPVSIVGTKVAMSYTLDMFNGEYEMVMNGYTDFNVRFGDTGDAIWLSETTRHTFTFTSLRNIVVQLPMTPTPTATSSGGVVSGPGAPLLQFIKKGVATEVYYNTRGQSNGIAGFELHFKDTNITSAIVHVAGFTVSTNGSIVIGMQISASPIELRADDTSLLLLTLQGTFGVLDPYETLVSNVNGDALDMSSLRVVTPTRTPTPTNTPMHTPTPTHSGDMRTVSFSTDAPIIQLAVRETSVDVYVNTHGQTSGFAGFQIAFDPGIIIDGNPTIHGDVTNKNAFIVSAGQTTILGMQLTSTPHAFRLDTPTIFMQIPIKSGSHVALQPLHTYFTDTSGSNLNMTSIKGTSRVMVSSVTPGSVLGDITGDGVCNIADIQKAIAEIFSPGTLTTAQRGYADINGDGIINITDIQLLIQIIFGTYTLILSTPTPTRSTPTMQSTSDVYRRVLANGFEMHANDELSILYFTRNGDILLEILPELGVTEVPIDVPAHCALMRVTHDWKILFPAYAVDDYKQMELQFIYKGHPQSLMTPMVSDAVIRSLLDASLYFSISGTARDAFWALTASVDAGIQFWFRETTVLEWVSQVHIGAMVMAGYTSIVRKIDVEA